jgi:uncharacterized protein (DUF1697 family)
MKLVALLRGVNVGGTRRVDMRRLRSLFEALGCASVSTYLNSGNVRFESGRRPAAIGRDVEAALAADFGIDIRVLVKTESEMRRIVRTVPADWHNDDGQRTDVAYLFPEADSRTILDELPFRMEFVDVRYTKGALCWRVDRRDVHRSHLNKLISNRRYQQMTVRNVNTARALAGHDLESQ